MSPSSKNGMQIVTDFTFTKIPLNLQKVDFNIGKHIQPLYSNLLEQNPQSIWQLSWAFRHEEDDHNLVFDV